MNDEAEIRHFLGKALDAVAGGDDAWSVMSTGEKLAVAVALNRTDWLARMDYTFAEAIGRIGPQWMRLLPRVVAELDRIADRNPPTDP